MAGNIVDVTDDDFNDEVIDTEGLVFVNFSSSDCGTCDDFEPAFKKLAREFKDQIKFVKALAEDASEAHEEHGVESYPHLVLFQDGEELEVCGDDETAPDLETVRDFLAGHAGDVEASDEDEDEEEEEEEASDEEDEEEEEEEDEEEEDEEASDEDEESEDEDEEKPKKKKKKQEEGGGLMEVATGLIGALFGGGDEEKPKKKRVRDDEEE